MNNKQRIEIKAGYSSATKAMEAINNIEALFLKTFKKRNKTELFYSIGGPLKKDTHAVSAYYEAPDVNEISWLKEQLS